MTPDSNAEDGALARLLSGEDYRATSMVAVLLGTTSRMICTGRAPDGTSAGTCKLTWYSPQSPAPN